MSIRHVGEKSWQHKYEVKTMFANTSGNPRALQSIVVANPLGSSTHNERFVAAKEEIYFTSSNDYLKNTAHSFIRRRRVFPTTECNFL